MKSNHIQQKVGIFCWYLDVKQQKYQQASPRYHQNNGNLGKDAMKLTNIKCQNAKFNPDGKGNKLSDGGGLFLHIQENGKYWRMNYRFLGKQKTLALGTYPRISLAEAREKRDAAKRLLDNNQDPMETKKTTKAGAKDELRK